jgi:hypothetical protein
MKIKESIRLIVADKKQPDAARSTRRFHLPAAPARR